MIIGTAVIDYEKLKSFEGRPEELITYVESLVPVWAKHIDGIVDNQKFYIAIHLRKVLTLSYKPRMELVEALTNSINIHGVISQFTPIDELVSSCDKEKLALLLKEGNAVGG